MRAGKQRGEKRQPLSVGGAGRTIMAALWNAIVDGNITGGTLCGSIDRDKDGEKAGTNT